MIPKAEICNFCQTEADCNPLTIKWIDPELGYNDSKVVMVCNYCKEEIYEQGREDRESEILLKQ